MRRLALTLALLGATSSSAQVSLTAVELAGQQQLRLNAASCDEIARLILQGTVSTQVDLVWNEYPRNGPNAPCPLDQTDPELVEIIAPETLAPIETPILNDEIGTNTLMGTSCETPRRVEVYVCPQFLELGGNRQFALDAGSVSLSLDIDTTIPPAATLTGLTGGDGIVNVAVETIVDGPDTYRFRVEHRLCPSAEFPLAPNAELDPQSTCGAAVETEETIGAAPSVAVPVANGRTVELRVSALDDYDNEGPPGDWRQGKPVADISPLGLYDGEENALSCDTSSCDDVSTAGVFGALALARLSRRRRRVHEAHHGASRAAGLLVLALACLPTAARAQAESNELDRRRLWTGLGRTTLSLAVGSYTPNIDAGSTFPVYGCFFGDAVLPQLSGAADMHIWDGFGSLQVGIAVDAAQASGFAQPLSVLETGTCAKATTTPVQVTFASLRPGLTYRFDPLLDWWSVPLVPYGRVGLVGMAYMFSKDGEITTEGTHKPIGARLGFDGAVGLMLALDFLDGIDPFTPSATRRARATGSFDHTFVFVEGAASDVTTFGQPGFDLSAKDVLLKTGFPATFRIGIAVELL